MLKKLLIILLAVMTTMMAGAETIHWLTFIDTTDENVGEIDKNGRKVLYSHFINAVNAALAEKGYKANVRDIYGTALTPQKCKELVSNLKCGPNDIVMFYYIGHGTHGTAGGDVWPMMFMAQHNVNNLVPLKWVHDQLKAKGARLTATIGMCCNVYQNISRRTTPTFSVNYGNTYMTDTEKNAIQKMFLGTKGDFLISSASPGQSSIGCDTRLGPMDVFTSILAQVFEEYASAGELDWVPLFDDVKSIIHQGTQGNQTPIYTSNLTKASMAPAAKPAAAPVKVTTKPAQQKPAQAATAKTAEPAKTSAPARQETAEAAEPTRQDFINLLGDALDNLIDVRQTERGRIKQSQMLAMIFSPDAVVKVMSRDGNIVVDKSSAEDFLDRLATSRILLKVTPVDFVMKDDWITELKVKETYKK